MDILNIALAILATVLLVMPTQKIGSAFISLLSKLIPSSTDVNKLVS